MWLFHSDSKLGRDKGFRFETTRERREVCGGDWFGEIGLNRRH